MLGWALQDGRANCCQLPGIQLRGATSLRHRAQCFNAAFIENTLPCVYGLASYAHRKRNFGTSLARKQ